MQLARGALLLAAVVFAGIGLGFLIVPVQWASIVEIVLPTAMARTDLRATYGGFDLAIGIFLALCARRSDWIRPGLAALAIAAAGFAGGRLLGILIEGTATPLMLGFAALETTAAVVAFLLFRRLSRAAQTGQ